MDHQAIAQLLGNYGEFVGAIAVVVTLAYLAVQLRQNTKAMRSATMQSLFESTNAVWENQCQSLQRTEQFFELGRKADLNEAEALYLQAWVLLTLRTQENIYYQRKLGVADDRFVSLEKRIRGAMSFPPISRAWHDGSTKEYLSDEYIEFVNSVLQAE